VADDDDDLSEGGEDSAGYRAFWSGAITFGLVTVPVALFAATRPRGVALRMIDSEGTPVQRRYVCSKDGQDLDWDDIVRGYEVSKGKFVVITDEELEAIEPRKSREIDLRLFVPLDDIDPVYFERAYYLAPAGGAAKAYRLLAAVMEKAQRVGIATFVMRAKEYLVAIIAEKGILRAETLRFQDEIRKPDDVGLPKKSRIGATAVRKYETLIAKQSGKVDFREFLDQYAKDLDKLVERKRRDGEDVVKAPAASSSPAGGETNVIDLMQVLRRSLAGEKGTQRKPPKRAAKRERLAAKKRSARKKS
jgi:DNA end-binding protein Ku